ncbi:hypothetical protein MP228_001885 [Amoeboaphelidium protococcarum]|nr:hypothetical protein MP228_001885 [Amoeboaphelidium protococcarum]
MTKINIRKKHLRKYKVSTYGNQGSKKISYSQSKAVPAEKTPSPANKFNNAFVSPDNLLRLNRSDNQQQRNNGDVVEQMADLDLEELHNHDVFDYMWEDAALDTGEQMANQQKRNKKKKKPSLFKVSFRRRNVRPDLTATFRDCVQACNDELYFKQYDYDVAVGCSACDRASSEVRCLTCDNCPQYCDACFAEIHRDKQFHLQQRLLSDQLAYKCGGSLSACCVDPGCKKSKHSVKLYQFPNGVAECEIDVCEHITSVKYGLFKALLALGFVACTASKPQYAIQLEVIKFYASLLRNSKCTASGFAASFSDVCYIGGSSYFRKHLLQSLRLYIALEKQFWKTHTLPFQFDCLACPNQVAAQYSQKIADIQDGELQADTGLTDEILDMSIALSQAQLPQIPHLLQIALDGNFKLNHLNRGASSGDVNNTEVISDKLFFVDSLCFDLLKDEYKQQSSSCSSFKAVTQVAGQLMSKFNDITGLFGACCARHGPAISRTYSNFEKGEKYLHADVAVLNVIQMLASFQDSPDQLKVYYDVGCQWVVNLARRIGRTDLSDIDVLVPALHLYAHQSYCQAKFSSKFSLWSGKTAGELMESLWSVIGNFGYITKNLCIAAREEVIDHILWKHSMELNDKIVLQIVQRYEIAEQELLVLEEYLYDHPVLKAQQMSVDEQCAAIILAPMECAPGDDLQKWTSEELYVKSLEDLQHMPNDRSLLQKVEMFELKLGIDAASRWTVQKVEYKDARIALVIKRCSIILRQLKSEMVEITVLLDYKGKNTSSQFKKKVFARALKSRRVNITQLTRQFNDLVQKVKIDYGVDCIEFEEFPASPSLTHVNFNYIAQNNDDSTQLRQLVHARQRCLEEMLLCRHESIQLIKSQIVIVLSILKSISTPSAWSSKLVLYQMMHKRLQKCRSDYKKLLPYINELTSQSHVDLLQRLRVNQFNRPQSASAVDDNVPMLNNSPDDHPPLQIEQACHGVQVEQECEQVFENIADTTQQVNVENCAMQDAAPDVEQVAGDNLHNPIQFGDSPVKQPDEQGADLPVDTHPITQALESFCNGNEPRLKDDVLFYAFKSLKLEAHSGIVLLDSQNLESWCEHSNDQPEQRRRYFERKLTNNVTDVVILRHLMNRGPPHWNVYHLVVNNSVAKLRFYCSAGYEVDMSFVDQLKHLFQNAVSFDLRLEFDAPQVIQGPKQKDGHSCGVYAFWYAKQIVKQGTISSTSKVKIRALRQEIKERLLNLRHNQQVATQRQG